MGAKPSNDGVMLQFFDRDGIQRRPPVFGRYVSFFSKQRPERPGEPDPVLGSQDWLTDVFVADTPDRLSSMNPTQNQHSATSKSSRHVVIRWHVGDDRGIETDTLTICTGMLIAKTEISTTQVMVLPKGTEMGENNIFFSQWKEGMDFLELN